MATKKIMESPEFLYLPLGSIIVEEQIRSAVDTTSESFKALMSSIKDKGVLEPVLVTQKDDKYLLLCGERRYLAAQKLGMETIPARIVNTVTQKDEILAIQLTENLQREDLNPIDQAKGILTYIQAKHPDKGYNLDGVMSILVSYKRRPEDLPGGVAPTVGAIIEISAKSITTLYNTISLLKLVPKIQDVIFSGKLPGEWRKGTSPLRSLRTGLELLSSSGSHYPAVGRIPICQCGNKEGCLLATPPNQYIALV